LTGKAVRILEGTDCDSLQQLVICLWSLWSLWSISQRSQRTVPARDIAKVLGYLHSKPEQGTR